MSLPIESPEPRQYLAADLALSIQALSVPYDWLVPGDRVTASVALANVGNQAAFGEFDLNIGVAGIADDAPLEIYGSRRYALNLAPGATALYRNITVTIGTDFTPGLHNFFAEAFIPDDSNNPIADDDLSNNFQFSTRDVELVYRFGTYQGDSRSNSRSNVKLITLAEEPLVGGDTAQQTITYSLTGGGYGEFSSIDGSLTLSNTGPRSSFSIGVKGGSGVALVGGPITINGSLKSFAAPAVDFVNADIRIAGSLGAFTARDISSSYLDIGARASSLKFTAAYVDNLGLFTRTPISSLKVTSWISADPAEDSELPSSDYIDAPFIASLTSASSFEPLLFLNGLNAPKGIALGKALIRGDVAGLWTVAGNAASISIGSASTAFEATFAGTLSSFTSLGNFSGGLSAFSIGKLDFRSDVIGAGIASGYFLGEDLSFGGEGSEADIVPTGSAFGAIASLTVRGGIYESLISAGLSSADGETFAFAPGQSAAIRKLSVSIEVVNSAFYGLTFPRTVKVGSMTLVPAEHADVFISVLS